VAEKVRAIVESTPAMFEDRAVRCTVSVGVASCFAGPETQAGGAAALYAAADAALFRAKKKGRNRVET
jgi:diguanylate cyclase (GGDEF)-like protein